MYNILGQLKTEENKLLPYKLEPINPFEERKYLILLKDIAELAMLPSYSYIGKMTGKTVEFFKIRTKKEINEYLNCSFEFNKNTINSDVYIKYLKEELNIILNKKDEDYFSIMIDHTSNLSTNQFMRKKRYRKYKSYLSKYR